MNIWIINHYAMRMYQEESGRHFWLAKFLQEQKHNVLIIGSSNQHFTRNKEYLSGTLTKDDVKFYIVKGIGYKSNGLLRILDMLLFSLMVVLKRRSISSVLKPDLVISSSPHLFAVLSGRVISRKFKIPLISEFRDLWPESIVAYNVLSKNNLLVRFFYILEKHLYIKSNFIVMTWEGGKDYLINNYKFGNVILDKTYYISNCVSIDKYKADLLISQDPIVDQENTQPKFVFTYTGSISHVNDLFTLVNAFWLLERENLNIELIIYGNGSQKDSLADYIKSNNITNVVLKGHIDKSLIPKALSESNVNILHNKSTSLDIYGQSQNKLFDYLAAGKPILQTYRNHYSIIDKYDAGYIVDLQTTEAISNMIKFILMDSSNHAALGENAKAASLNYDYKNVYKTYNEIIKKIII